jgi:predicted AlkP superfamily phosphohydrolase/phosphomutase
LDENTTVIIFSNHGLKAALNHPLDRDYYLLNSQKILKLLDLSDKISVTRMDRMEHLFVNSRQVDDFKTLVDRLGEIRFESNGKKLIKFVRVNEELKLVAIIANPGAITDDEDTVKYRNTHINVKDLLEKIEIPFSSVHDPNGIILIRGPRIKRNHEIQDASLIDVAPTILAILGLKADTTMDGRVLNQVFKDIPN